MDENEKAVAAIVATIARIDAIPLLLPIAYEISAMRVAILACVGDDLWTTGAVYDGSSSVSASEQLIVGTPLHVEFGPVSQPIVITPARQSPGLEMPITAIECCVATSIVLANGRRFGMLCAFDPNAHGPADPRIVAMFKRLSATIALQVDQLELLDREANAFIDERAGGQLREQFIAILGHDLRDPLHAISVTSDSLARQSTDPKVSAIASRIKAQTRRMSLLIDDIFDFARANLGDGIEVNVTEVENINSGLAMVVREIQDGQPDCEIISDIDVNRSVRCDLGRIQQVASNLVGNALTHGAPRSPIRIMARADESDLILEVWNAGQPIPQESLGKIFEPFWRHSTSRSRNGLGLGLHICSHIVRAHGGRISVISTQEGGTQFTARLPLGPREISTSNLSLPSEIAVSRSGVGASISASQ
jgi:signal transduction histidine kinase